MVYSLLFILLISSAPFPNGLACVCVLSSADECFFLFIVLRRDGVLLLLSSTHNCGQQWTLLALCPALACSVNPPTPCSQLFLHSSSESSSPLSEAFCSCNSLIPQSLALYSLLTASACTWRSSGSGRSATQEFLSSPRHHRLRWASE